MDSLSVCLSVCQDRSLPIKTTVKSLLSATSSGTPLIIYFFIFTTQRLEGFEIETLSTGARHALYIPLQIPRSYAKNQLIV